MFSNRYNTEIKDLFFFLLCCTACRILVPRPRTALWPMVSTNHWTTREFPKGWFKKNKKPNHSCNMKSQMHNWIQEILCLVAQWCLTLWGSIDWVHHAPLSKEFSRQEYWTGSPFPTPRYLPNTGIKPASRAPSALADGFFTTSTTRETPTGHLSLGLMHWK